MSPLREKVSADGLNWDTRECLPGFLGIEMLDLKHNTLTSRIPIKPIHIAINGFLHAASVVAVTQMIFNGQVGCESMVN